MEFVDSLWPHTDHVLAQHRGPATRFVGPRTRQIRLLQIQSVQRDLAANTRRLIWELKTAGPAHIAVLPELFLSGYQLENVEELAILREAPEMRAIAGACAETETAVVFGFIERDGVRVYNSIAAIDATGELSGIYRKVNLFGGEADAFEAGTGYEVVNLSGLRVGLLNCFDIEFPEPARALALAGAELLISLAANMDPYFDDHELASRARALDNRLPHVYVNAVGESAGMRFVGGSRCVRADGSVLTAARGVNDDVITAAVEVGQHVEPAVDYLRHLRGVGPVGGACTARRA